PTVSLLIYGPRTHRILHSFPTRRSSDLRLQRPLELMAQKRLRHPTVVRAIALIRRSYTNPNLRLTDVATAVGVTACHLSHLLREDRKSTRLNSSHEWISYAVFCLKKKTN